MPVSSWSDIIFLAPYNGRFRPFYTNSTTSREVTEHTFYSTLFIQGGSFPISEYGTGGHTELRELFVLNFCKNPPIYLGFSATGKCKERALVLLSKPSCFKDGCQMGI